LCSKKGRAQRGTIESTLEKKEVATPKTHLRPDAGWDKYLTYQGVQKKKKERTRRRNLGKKKMTPARYGGGG